MRLKSAEAIPRAISMNVARVTVPIWQSVTASQRKLYLIPPEERPESCPARDHNHQREIALAIAACDGATRESKKYADSGECFSSKMMPRFSTRRIISMHRQVCSAGAT
jgi:hypothetical protein